MCHMGNHRICRHFHGHKGKRCSRVEHVSCQHIYIYNPSFAVRASSNMLKHKMGSEIFLWSPQTFFSWPHKWGAHSGSRFEVYNVFFLAMFAECVSSFVRLTTLIVLPECLRGDLWFMFLPRVIRLTLCLPSLPGLGRCSAHQPDHRIS